MRQHNTIEEVSLIVFAKTLDVPVKTRIAHTEGKEAADRIYRELLDTTAGAIKDLPYHVAFAGGESPGDLALIFKDAVSFFPQTGENLGIRMKNACLHCHGEGAARFIVIGCDCPQRTVDEIVQASHCLLHGYNVVLGPVEDGGYHLAGVDLKGLAIFNAAKWSTKELLEETLEITRLSGLRTLLLRMRRDIDTIEDYARWKHRA